MQGTRKLCASHTLLSRSGSLVVTRSLRGPFTRSCLVTQGRRVSPVTSAFRSFRTHRPSPPQDPLLPHIQRHQRTLWLVLASVAAAGTCHWLDVKRQRRRDTRLATLARATPEQLAAAYPPDHHNHEIHLNGILDQMQRTALMGRHDRMRDDLQQIRQWHMDHGYRGGLVLRDLTKQAFGWEGHSDRSTQEDDDWTLQDIIHDPTRLARRECYYLYYEVKDTGQVMQQIFCRGTTLRADVLTCLEAWMEYDEDLGCRVHRGFRNQADRILKDVLPLLAPSSDRRSTIELCGHSLGGAVAMILAAKLRKRGYRNVIQVLSIAEPRFCWSEQDAAILASQLPHNTLRIECDWDFVTFLPPFGSHPHINKLWLIPGCDDTPPSIYLVDTLEHGWADTWWLNFSLWRQVKTKGLPHRIPYYVQSMKRAMEAYEQE